MLSELKSKICPATVLEITTSIGCLTVPMSTVDSKRMMTKAMGINRPLHQSHLATNELYGKMTTATLWICNNVISFPELKSFQESILSVPVALTESVLNYILKLNRVENCDFISANDIYRIGVELWTVGISQSIWNVSATQKLRVMKPILPSSENGANTKRKNSEIGALDDEYIKFWGQMTTKRILNVDSMSKIMKTCILNYWSAHLHHSRTRRYDMRAIIVKEVFEKIKLQYDSLNESVIKKRENMLKIYDRERVTLNQSYDEIKNVISLLTHFYSNCIRRFKEEVEIAVRAVAAMIHRFINLIKTNRDKNVDQSLRLTKTAQKDPIVINIWHVWPELLAGNEDGAKLNNINNKFHSGVKATNEIVLKRFTKCVCKSAVFYE